MQKLGRALALRAALKVCSDIAAGMRTKRWSKLCCSGANQPASSATNMTTALKKLPRLHDATRLLMLGAAIEPPRGFGG